MREHRGENEDWVRTSLLLHEALTDTTMAQPIVVVIPCTHVHVDSRRRRS